MSTIAELSRPLKLSVLNELKLRLIARLAKGPPEPALDGFIDQLQAVEADLNAGVEGKATAIAARKAQLARSEAADSDVDTLYRHHFNFIDAEANRRVGPYILQAAALRDAAFPDGLAAVDAYIPDENRACRIAISVLRSPEYAGTVAGIGLPADWTTKWEAALDESDAAFTEVRKAREATSANVDAGLDAETEFVDVAVRLRGYISSRAPRSDKAKTAEGVELLAPLTEALAKARAEAAARATRRKTASKGGSAPAPEAKPATPAVPPAPTPTPVTPPAIGDMATKPTDPK
jgi:hypothetical protein